MLLKDQLQETKEIFLKSVKDGNIFLFNLLLEPLSAQLKIAEIVDSTFGGNALHWAANNSQFEILKCLIEKCPELINSKSKNGSTPIINAATQGDEKILKYLLQHNADPMIRNEDLQNAFTVAADRPDNDGLKKYMQECQQLLNKRFIEAIQNEQLEDAEEWLQKGAEIETPIRKVDSNDVRYTALFHACSIGNLKLANFLIDHQANINVVGAKNGFSPLHAAVYFDHKDIVTTLKNAKANTSARDANGKTPLAIAQDHRFTEIATILDVAEEKIITEEPKQALALSDIALDKWQKDYSNSKGQANSNSLTELQNRINQLKENAYLSNNLFTEKSLTNTKQKELNAMTTEELKENLVAKKQISPNAIY